MENELKDSIDRIWFLPFIYCFTYFKSYFCLCVILYFDDTLNCLSFNLIDENIAIDVINSDKYFEHYSLL